MSDEIILHQYPASPFSEKIRRILAYKAVPWRAVAVPRMVPKPDLMPLTGGYRRTPVMQVGAQVYCDTALIAQELERRFPQPTLFPDGCRGAARLLAWQFDRGFFVTAVGVVFATNEGKLPAEFVADRVKFAPGVIDPERFARNGPHLLAEAHGMLALLEDALDGRPFLLGDRPSLADFSAFHVSWFLRGRAAAPFSLESYPRLRAWLGRIEAFPAPAVTETSAEEALDIARAATVEVVPQVDPADPCALPPLTPVTVVPDDMGFDPVRGDLVGLDAERITVRRSDPRAGELLVHFPRRGFRVAAA